MRRAAVIYNPIAGSGAALELSRDAARQLASAGWQVERIATRDRSGATEIARELSSRVDRVVVLGGDGSLRETISGLNAALGDQIGRVEVGLIPLGNANVVARELGIPLEPSAALASLLDPQTICIDIGFSNTELFLAVVGIGWDALAVHYLDRIRHSRMGRIWYRVWADSTYLLAGVLAMLQLREPRFRIRADGNPLGHDYSGVYFCNCRTYAKGWSMAPDASCQSGRLHYQARKLRSFPFLVWHLIAAFFSRRTPRFISSYGSAEQIEVESERPFPVQIDGDYRGRTTHLRLEIRPAALRMLVPRSDHSE